jgi:acyl-CoA synthetase (AMP-forming)/AMP-acid ligase II
MLGFSPVGNALIVPLENRLPPSDATRGASDGIVVLGGAIDGSGPGSKVALNEGAERWQTALLDNGDAEAKFALHILTEAFKPDPNGGQERLYLTGDLGLMRTDRCLLYKGRKDFRVKIRGYGVEVAEVEKRLLNHPDLREAIVVAKQNPLGESYLVACFTVQSHLAPTVSELRRFLLEKLADYMVPSAFVMLDAVPDLSSMSPTPRPELPSRRSWWKFGKKFWTFVQSAFTITSSMLEVTH